MGRSRRGRTWAAALLIATASGLSAGLSASWSAPPRYDGAGYAVLARSLLEGQGYRAIDHPDRPRHAHFPPGYPILLAATWRLTGISTTAARAVSVFCTVGACLASWCWFRRMMPERAAFWLGMALAVNWLWARTGGAIQSEPMFLLLGQLTILAAARGAPAVVLGAMLAACLLTRQIAVGLTMAVLIDLGLRRRWRDALIAATTAAILFSPWLAWMATAGRNQADLILGGGGSWPDRIAGQVAFYLQRIPDQITGPFVEVATSIRRSMGMEVATGFWMGVVTVVLGLGWIRTLRRPRRRLAGLVPIATLLVLFAWPYTEAGRFLIPMIPCILVGAEEGLARCTQFGRATRWLAKLLRRPRPPRRRLVAAMLVFATSLPYSSYALVTGKARAMEAAQGDFDAACAWLATQAGRPGPVLTRHPGEVFWRTGRQAMEVSTSERPGDRDADAVAIARTIDRYGVAYLLIDRERYAGAPASPLAGFVERFPDRVRMAWGEGSSGAVYLVLGP